MLLSARPATKLITDQSTRLRTTNEPLEPTSAMREVWSEARIAGLHERPSHRPSRRAAICTATNAAHAISTTASSHSLVFSAAVSIHSRCVVTCASSALPSMHSVATVA
jgi:hypothetical protein